MYETNKEDTLYSVALKFYPNNVIEGIYLINEKNNLYGKDLFLLEKFLDCPLGKMNLII